MIFEDVCSLRNIILYVTNFYLIIDKLSGEFLELEKRVNTAKPKYWRFLDYGLNADLASHVVLTILVILDHWS